MSEPHPDSPTSFKPVEALFLAAQDALPQLQGLTRTKLAEALKELEAIRDNVPEETRQTLTQVFRDGAHGTEQFVYSKPMMYHNEEDGYWVETWSFVPERVVRARKEPA